MKPTLPTSKSHYETLEVPPDADAATVKRAHRRLAKKHHPDRNGGSKEAEAQFQAVQRAYTTLKDPQKRAAYDQFGEASEGKSLRTLAENELCQLIIQAATALDVEHTHLLDKIRGEIQRKLDKLSSDTRNAAATEKKFLNAMGRLTKRGGGETFMCQALRNAAQQAQDQIKRIQFDIERGKEILNILNEHEYRVERRNEQNPWGVPLSASFIVDLHASMNRSGPVW